MPYIAAGDDDLGQPDPSRRVEVAREGLCQVCGLQIEGVAFAIMYTGDERKWPHDWIMDFGLVHEPCLRLAVQHCPVVSAWESMRLLRLALEDTVLTEDMQRTVPLDRHHDLSVDVESFR